MDFFTELSNIAFYVKAAFQNSKFIKSLNGAKVCSGTWKRVIDPHIAPIILQGNVNYNDDVVDLLRLVRNKWAHKYEVKKDMKAALPNPPRLELYFITKFPCLLLATYKVAFSYVSADPSFKRFFGRNYC
ncbi:serine/threonine-protein kinase/endoribonuclease IRE1a-like [Rhodamnia argentea]|uniref:Serine/threonine-protein kinase/endoribonuclease IRE1a-like n=1 Tax=Rhodamnia argentea TaxID=178133 RepID=A0ABM3HUZ4_9MYRT|nr:serine/threonine-protein kinase/endoribonuclease IRE1a-like [Rhodamnia argentea]